MPSNAKGGLWLWAGLLALLLVWGFLPLSTGHRVVLTVVVLLLVIAMVLWLRRQAAQLQSRVGQASPWRLPDAGFDGALVLVCGDSDTMFTEGSEYRQTHQGWYLATPTPEAFTLAVEWIAASDPMLLGQVSVALCVAPERHQDEALLRGEIHQWRMQFIRARRRLSRLPTVVLCGYLNGLIPADDPTANDWFVHDGDSRLSGMSVYTEDGHGLTLARWSQQDQASSRMAQLLWLDSAMAWLKAVVIDELHQPQTGVSAIPLSAVALRFTPLHAVENNLWQRAIGEQTTLPPVTASADAVAAHSLPYPDCLVPGLPGRRGLTPAQRVGLRAGALVWVFGVAALLASFANNHRLIRSVGDDLAFYHRLTGTPPEPKIQAQQQLRHDEQLLARYQRQGAPLSLGLGLYQGQVLHPPVQLALSDWVPPKPAAIAVKEKEQAQIVRLDSLSLFDSGKAVLKPDSTKMLVNSLVGIKARPGWLIVVSGHTDNTGNAKQNQTLSLQRAEAVRNWMRDTGDVPESCFAVQG
ncbi:OmpA family protein, partial [Serratia sp. DD3]|uniref:OmpA family protein n=1 Tax=Serratia sp. DD3 TaxID=1410619 RepID=UPI0005675F14